MIYFFSLYVRRILVIMSTSSRRSTPSSGHVPDTENQLCDPTVDQGSHGEITGLVVPSVSKSIPGTDGPATQDHGELQSSLYSPSSVPSDRTMVLSFLSGLHRDDDDLDPSQLMVTASKFYDRVIPKVRGPPVKDDCSILASGPPDRHDDNSTTQSDSSTDDDGNGDVTRSSVSDSSNFFPVVA